MLGITRNANEIAPRWRKRVDAQARQAGRRVRDVELAGLLEGRATAAGSWAADDRQDLLELRHLERRPAVEPLQRAVVAHDRRLADLQVDVAGAGGDSVLEQGMEIHENLIGSLESVL